MKKGNPILLAMILVGMILLTYYVIIFIVHTQETESMNKKLEFYNQ